MTVAANMLIEMPVTQGGEWGVSRVSAGRASLAGSQLDKANSYGTESDCILGEQW